jgi:branched-chain amino acid transport system substrate-binding protein
MQETALEPWVKRFAAKYSLQPSDYSITGYDAAQVAMDAIRCVAETGKPVTRDAVRQALMTTKLQTLQGVVSFDANGDITNHVVSIFWVQYDQKYPTDDIVHQYKYVGVARQESV